MLTFDISHRNTFDILVVGDTLASLKLLEDLCRGKFLIDKQFTSTAHQTNVGEKQIFVDELRPGIVITRDVRYKRNNYFHSQAIITPIFIESVF